MIRPRTGSSRGGVGQRRPSGQLRQLAHEFAGPMADNADGAGRSIDMGDLSTWPDRMTIKARADLADGEERRARLANERHSPNRRMRSISSGIEHRQHLLAALVE